MTIMNWRNATAVPGLVTESTLSRERYPLLHILSQHRNLRPTAAVGREFVLCRSCFREVSFTQHILSSNRMGAFILRGSAGSPTSTAPALLVTFVQNRCTCSSPRIPLSVSTASSTPLLLVDLRGKSDVCCRVQLKLLASFNSSSPSMIPYR